jgi:diguanylate cyclase (GGDEF)-like protein
MSVVVAEDDPVARMMLARILAKWGYVVTDVENGQEAWDALLATRARLLVTDWTMPVMSGVDLSRKIREGGLPYYVYVVLLTSRDDKSEILEGFQAGADDYLTKPFDRDELQARVRAGERIVTLEADLREARGRLEIMATTDELTGIANRRAALSRLQEALARAARTGTDLNLVMMDLDRFKNLNDTHGHAAGDVVLKEFVARVKPHLREYDVFGRIGGEEFVVVLPDMDLSTGTRVAERLRSEVSGDPIRLPTGADVRITVSAGICAAPRGKAESIDALLAAADAALYRAKAAGRDRVETGTLDGPGDARQVA